MQEIRTYLVRVDHRQRNDLEECAHKDWLDKARELREAKQNPNVKAWEIEQLEKSVERRRATYEAVKDSFLHVLDADALRLVLEAAEYSQEGIRSGHHDGAGFDMKETDAAIAKIESLIR